MQFDRVDDPGFVFIPTDLQYFIDFELKDSEKRALAAREGNILPREVPTSTLYSGISPSARGVRTRSTISLLERGPYIT
jgi:hypothetical protein